MPVRVIEVDDIDCRDADFVQFGVVVQDIVAAPPFERFYLLLPGDAPDFLAKFGGEMVGMHLPRKLDFFSGDHVEENGGRVIETVFRFAPSLGKMLRADEVAVLSRSLRFKDILFAVE